MASSSSSMNPSAPGLKAYFKTPEGRYKLQYEKTHSAGIMHYSHGKSVSQLTIAHLKEKQASQGPSVPSTPGSSGVVKSAAARLFVGVNGSKAFSFGGSNGGSKTVSGPSRFGGTFGGSAGSGSSPSANYDGKGTYLIFNAGDSLFISDLNSHNKDPIKYVHFSISYPLCHAFDSEAKDGHDLLIGLHSGDMSLRQQLQDPDGDGIFVSAHADGNLYVYGKNKDGAIDPSFPAIKDPTQFSVTHARSSKCNPIIRWHISQGFINNISFSMDGGYLATVGRDGYLRVFDYLKEQLTFGGKSYYGALLCCAWSPDGKYILTGGEDDLVQVWSMEERKIVAWGEGHNSWVSGVSFDSYWSAPNPDGKGENAMYRFGSVGQDTQLLLWDLEMDEISLPLRYPPTGGSPTFSSGSNSARWDTISPIGTLQPSPSMRDVPKLSPLTVHRAHVDPLSGLIFTEDSVVTICREGHIKIWSRPVDTEIISQANSDTVVNNLSATSEENHDRQVISPSRKVNGTSYKQTASIFLRN
ncbi:hypothetical protein IEQ34_001348 [Dendrobium chrysotoxum]|uniref:Dystrophia myotonica WD repeat-containing protein n=1 Tax=Dendrobium chrysotoxum TaxID=161865 RepID=A0AAV7HRA2_DENCH|nr:hypothetical protein IEQ34_001348 [Dendrobium chrysotoxum]